MKKVEEFKVNAVKIKLYILFSILSFEIISYCLHNLVLFKKLRGKQETSNITSDKHFLSTQLLKRKNIYQIWMMLENVNHEIKISDKVKCLQTGNATEE